MNRAVALVLLLSVVWSLSWPLIKYATFYFDPVTIVAIRMAIAGVALAAFLRLSGKSLPWPPSTWLPLLPIAIVGNALPYSLVAYGQLHVPSGLSAVLVGTMPVWTVLLTHFFSGGGRAGERLNGIKLLGAFSGLIGIVLLVGPTALEGLSSALLAELALLAAALCWACGTIYTSFVKSVPPDQSATMTALLASLFMLPVMAAWDLPVPLDAPWQAFAALAGLGLIATAFGTLLMFRIIARHGPTIVSMVMYLNPALALVWGALFFGEVLLLRHFAAFFFILAALWLINRGRRIALARAAAAE
ncbi:MAG: DMT family transporter [Reyranellaceae bacterium]